ncbi:MAG: leucyl aminopeptidase family protein [Xanthomonadaceae bacterium]|nr:leucyl aminopeptidase family protein [Xanthomonadaceae bacterium]
MKISLPTLENPEITQSRAALSERGFDRCAQLVLLVPKLARVAVPASVPYATELNARLKRGGWRKPPPHAVVELPNAAGTRIVVGFVKVDAQPFERQTAARKLVAASRAEKTGTLAVAFAELGDATSGWADAMVAAASAAAFDLAKFERKPAPSTRLTRVDLLGLAERTDFARTLAAAAGNNLARWLGALPGNALPPSRYRKLIAELAKRYGWKVETLDQRALARRGCGAFLAVVQASADADAAIVRLQYRPRSKARKTVALVGKGICFDTGGVNLKPARYMNGMHEDMLGSAVALGTLLALTDLRAPIAVDCWLALAQNHIGPRAYKPNDVVTASDGTTIEVVHTDAEGRMVLADTLALAVQRKPDLMFDYATLTGSCVSALGTRYSGVFSNRAALNEPLRRAGHASGERVWPFPMDADYDEALASKVADVKQCTLDNDADHILGARFLGRFVGDKTPWVHVDLSAGGAKGGLGAVPTDMTGFGVRFSLEALLGGEVMAAANRGSD